MLSKRELLTFTFVFLGLLLSAVTVGEVYAAKDVAACVYYDKVGLIDLATGNEATVLSDNDDNVEIMDIAWDKQSKNLFVLESAYIPGPSYESPGRSEVRLSQITLPSCSKTLLKTIKVITPKGYGDYNFPTLDMDKNGNPVITLFYNGKPLQYQQYTYNCSTKVLSAPLPKLFNNFQDGFKRQHQPLITTERGKYWNEEEGGIFTLNTIKGNRAIVVVNPKKLSYTYTMKEPIRYCVAPDSSFVLFGYVWDDEMGMGSTYVMNTDTDECTLLSKGECLGNAFIPIWMTNGKLVFLQKADYYEKIEKTSLKTVESNAIIGVLKEWQTEKEGPLKIKYRVR